MSQHADSGVTVLAKSGVVTYTGATLGGISMPDWAAILAGLVSLCILIQMIYRGALWVRNRFGQTPRKPRGSGR